MKKWQEKENLRKSMLNMARDKSAKIAEYLKDYDGSKGDTEDELLHMSCLMLMLDEVCKAIALHKKVPAKK